VTEAIKKAENLSSAGDWRNTDNGKFWNMSRVPEWKEVREDGKEAVNG
jgi:hypothetical protein